MTHRLIRPLVATILALAAAPAIAIDEEHRARAEQMADRAIEWLRTQQDAERGGWSVSGTGATMPAVTGLVVNGMLMHGDITPDDPHVARAVHYLLEQQQPDGGIYDLILPSYNTSISVSALSKVGSPETTRAVERATRFLRSIQWGEAAADLQGPARETTGDVGPDHPFYGGVGYGRNGRPDGSNLHFFVQALIDAGVEPDDPAIRRAVFFLQRTQMLDEVNDMPYADGSEQGGFIYSTSPNRDTIGEGESKAGTIEETLDDGTRVSRLRAYGSMTYAGFKTYVYAKLDREDPRVAAALDWITSNYTLDENPGIGDEGLYYYFVTFSRALDAFGADTIETTQPGGDTQNRDWANDLIDRLAQLQNDDGSFRSVHDRWMEADPVLITAYALIALQHAIN